VVKLKIITPAEIVYLSLNGGEFDNNIDYLLYRAKEALVQHNYMLTTDDVITEVIQHLDGRQHLKGFNYNIGCIIEMVKCISAYKVAIEDNNLNDAINATRNIIGRALSASDFDHDLTDDEAIFLNKKINDRTLNATKSKKETKLKVRNIIRKRASDILKVSPHASQASIALQIHTESKTHKGRKSMGIKNVYSERNLIQNYLNYFKDLTG
jgi:hypothetical protein